MTVMAGVLAAALGLLVGSFLNVVIWRVPRGESVVGPRSACTACSVPIAARDNVPVVSWLLLAGRCRHCETSISPRYAAVELLTAAVFVALTLRLGVVAHLPAYLYLGAAGVALAYIDKDTRRLPDVIVKPSYGAGFALLLVAAVAGGDWDSLRRAVLGAVALFAVFFLLRLSYRRGMGFGDVKLSGVLGLYLGWLGWEELVVGGFAGFLLGGVVGIVMMLRGEGRKGSLPFGPYMLVGALLAILVGGRVADAYLRLVLLG